MAKNLIKSFTISWFIIVVFLPKSWSQSSLKDLNSPSPSIQAFKGFIFYDPEADSIISSNNAEKFFTPASNIKILTLYTALNYLGKYAPALTYTEKNDAVIITGTGNPAFLHPKLNDSLTWQFLHSREKDLYYYPRPYSGNHFGPGWAWEDYKFYFATEKAPFPIYGNIVNFKFTGQLSPPDVSPAAFEKKTVPLSGKIQSEEPVTRALDSNYYYFKPQPDSLESDIPFRYSTNLFLDLLEDTLKKKIHLASDFPTGDKNTIFSTPMDSIYKEMMHESSNFLAEQIIMMCSAQNGDTLHTEKVIENALTDLFADYPDSIKWVDGSGLSRYNLVTPRTIVKCLQQIEEMKYDAWLFDIFPVGGEGSLEDYPENHPPFIYAKTGSMGGIHCLSGYLLTDSGKKIIFSYMVNNFVAEFEEVRQMIYDKLMEVKEEY